MTATREKTWTVEEYHRIIEAGILNEDDKIELLDGRIVEMSAQTPPHAATTQRSSDYIKEILAGQAHIRTQLPITLATSEPEPDIAVVAIDPSFYATHHPNPSEIFLLIEVSYSTLQIDRYEKAPIYARANIAEYWILNVLDREAHIYRNPGPQGYQSEVVLQDNSLIRMLAFPDIEISLSELFFARAILAESRSPLNPP
ncbi:MAG: Uma2 family endonuclease [Microcoleus sp. SU_5_6]|nr:Uma2 family endonuclease [Microcoleus sp. SU_5_6]